MSLGWLDRVRVAGVSIGFALALVACNVGTLEAPPAYPGSSLGPGSRYTQNGTTSLKQMYQTPDAYAQVVDFYKGYVAKQGPGWQGGPSLDVSTWSINMESDSIGNSASPIDPKKPGKMVVVMNANGRVIIQTFASYPDSGS